MLSGGGDPEAYFGQWAGKTASLVAEAIDVDGDGFIEESEYLAVLGAATSVERTAARAGFARLDADGDGRISRDELVTGASHPFLSADQSDPGTTMLG